MTQSFELHAPESVIAGFGSLSRLGDLIAPADLARILLLTDAGITAAGLDLRVREHLDATGRTVHVISSVSREPSVSDVESVLGEAREFRPTLIVGLGGGSVLDVAKLLGVLADSTQTLLELVHGAPVGRRTVDTLLVPTTAGTGSEATKNAILSVPEEKLKVGIISPALLPRFVILDADLTISMPPLVTATTGVDALAHAVECYLSNKANPLSDLLALEATQLIAGNLTRAFDDPHDREARQSMLAASFYAGMCITLAGTTAVHALSYPLGAVYHVPHGQANAMLLPQVMEFNRHALPEKSLKLANAMGVPDSADEGRRSAGFVEALEGLLNHLRIPRGMSAFGVTATEIPQLVEAAYGIRRLMDNNPREMSRDDMQLIYEGVL